MTRRERPSERPWPAPSVLAVHPGAGAPLPPGPGPAYPDPRGSVHTSSPTDRQRADRDVIQRAARMLRDHTIRGAYAGLTQPSRGFAIALTLDGLARHVRDLDSELRGAVVVHCHTIVESAAV